DLRADSLLLVPTGKDGQRTVKILHAGVGRGAFDETALGRSVSAGELTREQLERALELARAGNPEVAQDLFRLGCVFYRAVTGQAPYAEKDLPYPTRAAKPVAEVAP